MVVVGTSSVPPVPVDRQTIRYGLGAVKGTGEQAVNVILKARDEGGPFKDLFDFCRIDIESAWLNKIPCADPTVKIEFTVWLRAEKIAGL